MYYVLGLFLNFVTKENTMMKNRDIADILVIGAGASGAAVTWRIAEKGLRVLCLEQGPWLKPEIYPPASAEWELRQSGDFHLDPNFRGLPEDYPLNNSRSDIDPLMFNAVGGSTIHWTAHAPRFHPSDFRVKTLDGVAADWPISYYDLEPYYDINDRMMGCSGLSGDPANPPRKPRSMPPASHRQGRRAYRTRFRRTGMALVGFGQLHKLCGV